MRGKHAAAVRTGRNVVGLWAIQGDRFNFFIALFTKELQHVFGMRSVFAFRFWFSGNIISSESKNNLVDHEKRKYFFVKSVRKSRIDLYLREMRAILSFRQDLTIQDIMEKNNVRKHAV